MSRTTTVSSAFGAEERTTKKVPQKGKQKQSAIPPPPVRRAASASDESYSDDDEEGEDGDQKAAMLAALQAHTRALFGLEGDGPDQAESSASAQRRATKAMARAGSETSGDGAEEESEDEEGYHTDDGWGADDGFVTDSEDEFASQPAASSKPPSVPEVVFAPTTSGSADLLSKAERRAFLSGNTAKMMGIKHIPEYGNLRKRQRVEDKDDADDQSNLKLDKTLHEMLVNNLLPSATLSAASRPVDKRTAIQGRLLELASISLPGEGHATATSSNARLSSHPAKVRTGILKAQEKRDEKAREEAKASGNWVRGLGALGEVKRRDETGKKQRARVGQDVGKKKGMEGKKKGDEARDRGLGMGIGRFEGGMLKLSKGEIARASGENKRAFKKSRGGRGGKRR